MSRHSTACVLLLLAASCDAGEDPPDVAATTAALTSDPIQPAAAVGSLDGTPEVTADGAATYSIPLEVPPGRAGMQPELSLEYSSQRGVGLLGVGWGLSGTSQIMPCGSTPGRDGVLRPVQLRGLDNYCLDGARLISVGGTEFRIEGDTGTQIMTTGFDGNGPTGWEVRTRDGRITHYGTIVATATRRIAWLRTRVDDRSGNFMGFTYNVSTTGGLEWSLARIDYAGFLPSTPGTRSVELTYAERDDDSEQYVAGIKLRATKRLASVTMKAPNPVGQTHPFVRRYDLTYEYAPLSKRSRLQAITLCPAVGACLRPTTFVYKDVTPSFAARPAMPTALRAIPDHRTVFVADVDGDGRDDLVYRDTQGQASPAGDRFAVRKSNGSSLGPAAISAYPSLMSTLTSPSVYDGQDALYGASGDGKVDLIGEHDEGECVRNCGTPNEERELHRVAYVYPSNGSGFGARSTLTPSNTDALHSLADLDGDLRPEVLYTPELGSLGPRGLRTSNLGLQDSAAWRALDRCNGQATCDAVHPEMAKIVDIDDDGAADVLLPYVAVQDSNNTGFMRYDLLQLRGGIVEAFPTSLESEFTITFDVGDDGLIYGRHTFPIDGSCSVFADVNGDGLRDLVSVRGGINVRMNLGTGDFGAWQNALAGSTGYACVNADEDPANDVDPAIQVVDYNQDGLSDLLVLAPGIGASQRLLLSTGTGFVQSGITLPFGGVADSWASRTLDVDGDGLFDMVQFRPNAAGTFDLELYVQGVGRADLLDHVENGFGVKTWAVGYSPHLWQSPPTPPASTCVYPVRCAPPSGWVVVEEWLPNATSSMTSPASGTTTYQARTHQFSGGRLDATGWGSLGFAVHTVTHRQTGRVVRTTYDQRRLTVAGRARYPFVGMPVETVSWVTVGSVVQATRVVPTYATREVTVGGVALYFPYASKTETYDYEVPSFTPDSPPATFLRKSTTTVTVDDLGNKLEEWVDTANVSLEGVVRNYVPVDDRWLVGLVNQEWTQSWQNGVETRSHIYGYDTQGRLVETRQDVLLPASQQLCTHLTRGTYAQVTKVDVIPGGTCAPNIQTRTIVNDYAGDATFATQTTNALGQVDKQTFHPGLGVVLTATDVNNLTTTSQYDGFGRQVKVTSPSGTSTSILRDACPGTTAYAMCATKSGSDGSLVVTYLDKLGQTVRTSSRSFDDKEVVSDPTYDTRGRLTATRQPRYTTDAAYYAERITYDRADRVVQICQHDSTRCARRVYAGLVLDSYDEDGKRRTTRVDGAGQVVASSVYPDGAAVTTTYEYGPFSTLRKVTDALGNVVSLQYDSLGRQTRIDDEDLGFRTLAYDAFGQITTLTDAKGQVSTSTYDRLGRRLSRVAPDGTDTWTWDTAVGAGKGRLAQQARGTVSTKYSFDGLGRLTNERWSIGTKTFDYDLTYDTQSRIDTFKYPTVTGRPRLTIKHLYGNRGHLKELDDVSTATVTPRWTLLETLASGSRRKEKLGNTYVTEHIYDPATGRLTRVTTPGIHDVGYNVSAGGNVLSRTDYRNGATPTARTETFTYDGANRLLTATIPGRAQATNSYGYDVLGNLTSANDIPNCGNYVYGGGSAGPHQLVGITCWGTVYGPAYDANGNETYTLAPDYREQTWTSFDKVLELASRNGRLRYTYDADHRRVKKERVPGALSGWGGPELPAPGDYLSGVWDTTFYAGDLYERREISGSTTIEHVFYLMAGGAPIGQLTWKESPSSEQWLYFHRDAQGTIERFTDGAGVVAGAASYDAWGVRRNPDWLSGTAFGYPVESRLGYGGHEHDDEVGSVINMGGRTYDAYLRRFTSPDPVVQAPEYGPSWNRYSYVFNNPLRYTDPTGHDAIEFDAGADAEFWEFFGEAMDGAGTMTGARHERARLNDKGEVESHLASGRVIKETVTLVDPGMSMDDVDAQIAANKNEEAVQAWQDATAAALNWYFATGKRKENPDAGPTWNEVFLREFDEFSTLVCHKTTICSEIEERRDQFRESGQGEIDANISAVVVVGILNAPSKGKGPKGSKGKGPKGGIGHYEAIGRSGKAYAGKGSPDRSAISAQRLEAEFGEPIDELRTGRSDTVRESFKMEDDTMQWYGGAESDRNFNKINSPGKKFNEMDRKKK